MRYNRTIDFIKELYLDKSFIPLHEPKFIGNEKKYVIDAIDSTYVSSVGEYVNKFESMMAEYIGCKYAIAVVNGTAALHMSLLLAGVEPGDLVITQALTFVATANAIKYAGADPLFLDVDLDTLGLSPVAFRKFSKEIDLVNGVAIHKKSGRRIKACLPMHTFGFPCKIDILADICKELNIALIEDAAEAIGSEYMNQKCGSFGLLGTFSFNGNKTITCGGGGIIVTNDDELGPLAKHLTTQAKIPHKWFFNHDYIGYNYRCPNLNAAMACAQLEILERFIQNKRETAEIYEQHFIESEIEFLKEPVKSKSNYWLNSILLPDLNERDRFLEETNSAGVMTRPIWTLLNKLPMFSACEAGELNTSLAIESRLVNIPSSVRI